MVGLLFLLLFCLQVIHCGKLKVHLSREIDEVSQVSYLRFEALSLFDILIKIKGNAVLTKFFPHCQHVFPYSLLPFFTAFGVASLDGLAEVLDGSVAPVTRILESLLLHGTLPLAYLLAEYPQVFLDGSLISRIRRILKCLLIHLDCFEGLILSLVGGIVLEFLVLRVCTILVERKLLLDGQLCSWSLHLFL